MVREMSEIAQTDSGEKTGRALKKVTNPEMNPDEFVAAMDEIEHLSDAGIYRESIAKLEKLFVDNEQYFENDERFLDYCILKGHSLYKMDKFEEAIEVFDVFIEMRPNSPNVMFLRAKCNDYLDRLEDAEKDYKRVIQLDPEAPAASYFLGLVLISKGDITGAKLAFEAALKLNPDDELATEQLKKLPSMDQNNTY